MRLCECGCGETVSEGIWVKRHDRDPNKLYFKKRTMRFKDGHYFRTQQAKEISSQTHKGIPFTDNHKGKISAALRGKKKSPEAVANMIAALTGRIPTEEEKRNVRVAMKRPDVVAKMSGPNNHRWKGEEVGYQALHDWVRRYIPRTELCQFCNVRQSTEIACVGQYKRDKINWAWACHSCHVKYDKHRKNR